MEPRLPTELLGAPVLAHRPTLDLEGLSKEGLKWASQGSRAPGACGFTLFRLWACHAGGLSSRHVAVPLVPPWLRGCDNGWVWHRLWGTPGGFPLPRDAPVSSLLCKCSSNIPVKPQPACLTASHL